MFIEALPAGEFLVEGGAVEERDNPLCEGYVDLGELNAFGSVVEMIGIVVRLLGYVVGGKVDGHRDGVEHLRRADRLLQQGRGLAPVHRLVQLPRLLRQSAR